MRGNEVEGGRKMHTHARETPGWEEVLDYPEETKPLGGMLQLAWKGLKIPTADPRICSFHENEQNHLLRQLNREILICV